MLEKIHLNPPQDRPLDWRQIQQPDEGDKIESNDSKLRTEFANHYQESIWNESGSSLSNELFSTNENITPTNLLPYKNGAESTNIRNPNLLPIFSNSSYNVGEDKALLRPTPRIPTPRIAPRPILETDSAKVKLSFNTRSSVSPFQTPDKMKTAYPNRFYQHSWSPVPSLVESIHSESMNYSNNSPTFFGKDSDKQPSFTMTPTIMESQPSMMMSRTSPYYFTPLMEGTYESESKAYGRNNYESFGSNASSSYHSYSNTPTAQSSFPVQHVVHYWDRHSPIVFSTPISTCSSTSSSNMTRGMSLVSLANMNGNPNFRNSFIHSKQNDNDGMNIMTFPPLPQRKGSTDSSSLSNNNGGKNMNNSPPSSPMIPLPQNLKGDPCRQAKVKTELCLHYMNGSECPFGSRCNYAHGMEELKYTKLIELEEAGLIEDVSTYRTHVCLSWVSTGACPFGQRCTNLHDPRVTGELASWLPHSDVPVATLSTTLNVDKSYHLLISSLHQENPLVQKNIWDKRPPSSKYISDDNAMCVDIEEEEWNDTYALVCNLIPVEQLTNTAYKVITDNALTKNREKVELKEKLSDLERLSIVVQMSYMDSPTFRDYVYKPKHVVFDELCMVLQTKYFKLIKSKEFLTKNINTHDASLLKRIACEITEEEYNGYRSFWDKRFPYSPQDVVVVRELAFACSGETSSQVSIWFDLSEIQALSHQEIKRLKRARQRAMPHKKNEPEYTQDKENGAAKFSSMIKSGIKPFLHLQPLAGNPEAFCLTRSILLHRVSVLIANEIGGSEIVVQNMQKILKMKKSDLRDEFKHLKKSVHQWKWPVTSGRENVHEDTPLPSCTSEYHPCYSSSAVVHKIWNRFVEDVSKEEEDVKQNKAEVKCIISRLRVFRKLARGFSIDSKSKFSVLPHLGKRFKRQEQPKETTWKSIMMPSTENNEWQLIKDHYLSSSTNKDKNMPLSSSQVEKNTNVGI